MPGPVIDPRFGARLRELREAKGLSQRMLGRMVPCSHVHIHQMEQGRNLPSPGLAARLDHVLSTGGELAALSVRGRLSKDHEQAGRTTYGGGIVDTSPSTADRVLANVRAALVPLRWSKSRDTRAVAPDLASTAADARAAHHAYQRADYAASARLLPEVTAAAEHLVRQSSGEAQQRAHKVLAVANLAVSKLAAKLGDGELAWITADRAASSAFLAEDRMIGAVAAYQIGCALLSLPDRLNGAAEVVAVASDELNQRGDTADPADISARGALLLLGALVAARQGDHAAAADRLDDAGELATSLGHDDNHLFTGFGPTNFMIHQVSVAVELQRPDRAIQIGDQLDTSRMPAALVSRRAQVHLDLALAYAKTTGGDAPAVLHLLEVERMAPQVVGVNRTSRALLTRLIERERRSATPGLRALAHRAGVLV